MASLMGVVNLKATPADIKMWKEGETDKQTNKHKKYLYYEAMYLFRVQ